MTPEKTYSIFFRGEAAEGAELDQVKLQFSKLFKADDAKLNQLFSGKVIPLKRNLAPEEAAKFQQLFKKTGAKIYLKEDVLTPSPEVQATTPQPIEVKQDSNTKAVEKSVTATPDKSSLDNAEVFDDVPYQKPTLKAVDMNSIHFDLSPTGCDLLDDADKHPFIDADLDLSDISLAEAGGLLVTPDSTPPPAAPDTHLMSLAAAGETLGHASDKAATPSPDTSHLSMAGAGENLQEFIDDIPDFPPNTAHLSMAAVGETIETLADKKEAVHPDISHISLDDSA